MSRNLPARPNLEYLRKQAKDLLAELRQRDADAKLADAQHAIAREYGFATWPQLKAFVESLPLTVGGEAVHETGKPASPFTGTWVADVSRSRRHPLNEYRAATLQFIVDGDVVTIDDVVVDASGGATRTRNVLIVDGHDRPGEYGYIVTARWMGPRTLEAVVTKDGAIEGRVVYDVAPDASTLTLTTTEHATVFTRQGA